MKKQLLRLDSKKYEFQKNYFPNKFIFKENVKVGKIYMVTFNVISLDRLKFAEIF